RCYRDWSSDVCSSDLVLRLIALGVSLAIAAAAGAGMMAEWSTLALYWYAPSATGTVDPIFGRPLNFYLFTLPAWQLIAGWLTTRSEERRVGKGGSCGW